jgi:hypothetical protein
MKAVKQLTHALPYPGMRPFGEGDDDLFFGQDAQIDALVERLGESRLVAIMGESGCGKSSLVKAGLIPRLRGGRVDPELNFWHTAVSRPATSPIVNMAEKLSAPGALKRPRAEIERELYSGSHGLVEAVAKAELPRGHRMLVVIDQFEELFRFAKSAGNLAVARRDEASLFVKLLLAVSEARKHAPLYVVLTMRSEYLGDSALFYGLAEAMNRGSYLLPKMTRSQIEAAITGPLRVFGAGIENDLLQTLLNETEAAQQDGLPLLQHGLRRIWETAEKRGGPTRLKYADFAGVDEAAKGTLLLEKHLNEHLDGIYRALTPTDAIAAQTMFKQLGEYDGKGRLVRRNCDLPTVAAVCERTPAQMLEVVNQFRDEKSGRTFLMPPEESTQALLDGDEPLDISHESLLRRWELLRSWIGEEARDADEFRSLAGRAARHGAALRGLELAQAGNWVRRFKPSPAWASRYAGVTEDPARAAYPYREAMSYYRRSHLLSRLRLTLWSAVATLIVIAVARYVESVHLQEDSRVRAEFDRKKAAELEVKNKELGDAKRGLEEANVETQRALKGLEGANRAVQRALSQKTSALEEVQKKSNALAKANADLEVQRRKAEEARGDAVAEKERANEQRDLAAAAAKSLEVAQFELEDAYKKLEKASARTEAAQGYRLAATQPVSYDPATPSRRALELVEAAKKLRASGEELPADVVGVMYQALAMTRLVGNDHNAYTPVLFVYPDAAHPDHPVVLRQGGQTREGDFLQPRKGWTVERAAISPEGQIAYGGTGGYVAVQESGQNASAPRKLFPFAMTGLGFSVDGKWVAMADSSSNMRIQRTADLAANGVISRKLTQFATGYKLMLFLLTRRFQGEYPVRQWALSVNSDRPDDRNSVSAAALTESGRLLTWQKPGPIGKQLSLTDRRTVGEGHEFTAITTHPLTQKIWAASNDSLGTLVFQEPPSFETCAKLTRASVSAMAWNSQGTRLALGLRAGELRVMARDGGPGCGLREILSLPAHAAAVTSVIWKGDLLASGSMDGSARVWNLTLDKDDESLFRKLRAQQDALSFDELADQVLARIKK